MSKRQKIKLIYMGQRFRDEKMEQVFEIEGKDTTIGFTGIKGIWIGHAYEAEISDDKKKTVHFTRRPKEIPDFVDKRLDKWQQVEIESRRERTKYRERKRAENFTGLKEEIVKIREFLGDVKSYWRVQAFVEYLTDEIMAEERAKEAASLRAMSQRMSKSFQKNLNKMDAKLAEEKAKNGV